MGYGCSKIPLKDNKGDGKEKMKPWVVIYIKIYQRKKLTEQLSSKPLLIEMNHSTWSTLIYGAKYRNDNE